jgi:hypothetical protein
MANDIDLPWLCLKNIEIDFPVPPSFISASTQQVANRTSYPAGIYSFMQTVLLILLRFGFPLVRFPSLNKAVLAGMKSKRLKTPASSAPFLKGACKKIQFYILSL